MIKIGFYTLKNSMDKLNDIKNKNKKESLNNKEIKNYPKKEFVTYEKDSSKLSGIVFEIKNLKAAIVSTDTVSGLLSLNKPLIYKIKRRDKNKKLIKFVSNLDQIPDVNETFKKLANKFWPGKLTLIYKKESYRMPNDQFILNLIDKTGPLYSSSANLSGNPPITNIIDAFESFNKYKSDIIFIEGDYYQNNQPSTIYDIDTNTLKREGEIKYEWIKKTIEEN